MRKIPNIAAVVVAAGLSSRMRGIKPLLKLGRATALERTTESLLLAGIYDITLVTGGWRDEIMEDYLFRGDVREIYNPAYETGGMFSSVKAGVGALPESVDAFLFLPGDCAAIRSETIFGMVRFYLKNGQKADVVQPVFEGVGGHPILLSRRVIPEILLDEVDYPRGLRSVIELFLDSVERFPVKDSGILMDMDERADYYRMEETSKDEDRSYLPIAMELLKKADIPVHIKEHCVFVARIAGILTEALQKTGIRLDDAAIGSAALLHDIERLNGRRHAADGRVYAFDHGLVRAGAIIGAHMGEGIDERRLSEKEIVFFSDKCAVEDVLVSIDRRFGRAEYRQRENGDALANIKRVRRMANEIQANIERILREPVYPLLTKELRD